MSQVLPIAQVTRVDNGYVVKFMQASEQERPQPPLGPPGHLELQAAFMLAMAEVRDDDSEDAVDPDGGWERGKAKVRRDKFERRVREIERTFANRKIKGWVLEVRTAFAPSLEGVTLAIAHAAKAHEQVVALINHGVQFLGPLQPVMLQVPE